MTGQRRTAFSRRDALVAVMLVGLFLAVLVPFLLRWRLEARRKQSANNLRRLVLATRDYADHHADIFPLGCDDKHFSVVAKTTWSLPHSFSSSGIGSVCLFDRSIAAPLRPSLSPGVSSQPLLPPRDKRSFRNVHVVAVAGGESRPVSFLANGETVSKIAWSPDGHYLLFDTAQRSEQVQIARVDLLPHVPKYREDEFRELFRPSKTPGTAS